jgi:hypothetical protein
VGLKVSPNARQIERLAEALQDPGSGLPAAVIALCHVLFAHIAALAEHSKMGQRDLRRLPVSGAMTVVRWALRKGAPEGPGSGAC